MVGPKTNDKMAARVLTSFFLCFWGAPKTVPRPTSNAVFIPFPPTLVEAYANNLAQKLSRKSSQSGRAAELVRDNQLMYAIYACLIQLNCFWVE